MALQGFSLRRLSDRVQVMLFGVITLGLAGVFYLNFLGPLNDEVSFLKDDIEALRHEIEEGQAVKAQLPHFKRMVEEQQSRLNQLRRVLPDGKETAEIIRRVQELAVESKLKIKSFTPQPTIDNEFYEDWPILVSLEGSYHNLGTFFEKVSQFTRIINVEDINIKALEDASSSGPSIGATCTATTFVYVEEENVHQLQGQGNEVAAAF